MFSTPTFDPYELFLLLITLTKRVYKGRFMSEFKNL